MSSEIKTSVILVNYNTKQLTLNCIESIYAYTKKYPFEIILVDNNSHDGSVETIKNFFPTVRIIENEKNIGFGCANNKGAGIARGDFLFMLNTDTVITCDAISKFVEFYEINRSLNIGVVGGRILNEDLSHGWSSGNFNTIEGVIFNFYKRALSQNNKNKIPGAGGYLEVDYITGANLFMKKQTFQSINGFDENIFLYYEDEDMQRRLSVNGLKSYIIESVKIIHKEGSSMPKVDGRVSNSKRIIMERSMFYYFKKWHGSIYKNISKCIYFILISLPLRMKYGMSDNILYIKEYFKF